MLSPVRWSSLDFVKLFSPAPAGKSLRQMKTWRKIVKANVKDVSTPWHPSSTCQTVHRSGSAWWETPRGYRLLCSPIMAAGGDVIMSLFVHIVLSSCFHPRSAISYHILVLPYHVKSYHVMSRYCNNISCLFFSFFKFWGIYYWEWWPALSSGRNNDMRKFLAELFHFIIFSIFYLICYLIFRGVPHC